MTTLFVPPQYGLISIDDIQMREELCSITIKISNKVFNEFPLMSVMDHYLILHIWMMDPSNMPPHQIEMVPTHAGLAKIRIRTAL